MNNYHTPVMLKEVLEYLDVKPGKWYVDCNLGGGGHTKAILSLGGKVIGIDLDPGSIKHVVDNYQLTITNDQLGMRAYSENLILVQGNFADLKWILNQVKQSLPSKEGQDDKHEIASAAPRNDVRLHGVLYDLGVSSYQLETPQRGFSFSQNAPLDMRMDISKQSATAADLVNGLHERELAELFWKLGEESYARPIAKAINRRKKIRRIETTNELVQIILAVKKPQHSKIHPATQVFQALRIAVNDELNSLKASLPQAFDLLEPGGRLVVISFHSLEDRIVKEFLKGEVGNGRGKLLVKKPLEPSEEEVLANPRSRSGKLRVIEKL